MRNTSLTRNLCWLCLLTPLLAQGCSDTPNAQDSGVDAALDVRVDDAASDNRVDTGTGDTSMEDASLDVALLDSSAGDSGSSALNTDVPPSDNFDLRAWKITFPDGSEEDEAWLTDGGEHDTWFHTDEETGGVVFRSPNVGTSTSGSTYTRSELREMLRTGDDSISTRGLNGNNWVLSSSSDENQNAAGGVDGVLEATLRVDHVSTTGDESRRGRVIVGQIHAADNEPCRLYFRLLPGHERGSIYFAYEPNEGDEEWVEIIGSRESGADEPADGIALGDVWSYIIDATGDTLTVTVRRDGREDLAGVVDMSEGALADDWMYFKAGVYNQNNTGADDDYVQATFFALAQRHD